MFNQAQAIACGARARATSRLSAGSALSILAVTLIGCGAPAPKEYGGSWAPVNRFQKAVTEIPLSPAYTFYASPMDATLSTMLKRWASDNGLQLSSIFVSRSLYCWKRFAMGRNTRGALKAFQREHHLKETGSTDSATLKAIDATLKERGVERQVAPTTEQSTNRCEPSQIADPAHPGNMLFKQAQAGMQAIDAKFGRTSDHQTDNAAGHVAVKAQCAGMKCIDVLELGGASGDRIIAVQGMAGYNMRLLPIIQSMAQLDATYGKEVARTLITNHALQIIYAPREQQDANDYSDMLGYTTVRKQNVTRGRETSRSESEERRALMLPQELKAMGPDTEVFLYEGIPHPVKCDKIRYYQDSYFTRRLKEKVPISVLSI